MPEPRQEQGGGNPYVDGTGVRLQQLAVMLQSEPLIGGDRLAFLSQKKAPVNLGGLTVYVTR